VPVTLELGGKSPQIVFADADLDAALPFLVNAGIQNAARPARRQPHPGRAAGVRRGAAPHGRALPALRVGPALDDLDVGPVISARQREIVQGLPGLARDTGLQVAAQARCRPACRPAAAMCRPRCCAGRAGQPPPGAGGDLRPGAGGDPV
jgi:aldehyde dehydrogenase (NAD+)